MIMKKDVSKNKFVYNYKYSGADKRSLVLFTLLLKVLTGYLN